MEHIVVITAVGRDRPGMIAALTRTVLDAGGTLDDATMTRLHGAFATMLAARLPSPAAAHGLRDGADRPGIVHAVTRLLGDQGVNITDMDTRVAGTADAPTYVMLLEASSQGKDLAGALDTLRRTLGVDITQHPLDTEAL